MMRHTMRILNLGAGLDSTTLLLMSEHGELPRPDYAIFADTQAEPQYVYETLEWLSAHTTIPIVRVSAGNLREDILTASSGTSSRVGNPPFRVRGDNGPSMLKRDCTTNYKIVPIRRKLRELLGLKPMGGVPKGVHVEQWIGFTLDELGRTFCSDVQWITNTFPLILPLRMRRRDCEAWLIGHGYPVPQKSSCTFCPYHSNAYWRQMRDERPEEWRATVAFERQIHAGKLPGVRGQVYLHRSLLPLAQAPIDDADTSPDLFCYSCNT